MNILLIQCSDELGKYLMPPIGLLSLASYLRTKGFDAVRVLDISDQADQAQALRSALERTPNNDTLLVGFNMNTHTRFQVQRMTQVAREVRPEALICCGGPHPTLDREGTLTHCPDIDFLVCGEGEATIIEVTAALENDFRTQSLAGIPGLSLRVEEEIIHGPDRPRIADLDELPMPDRSLLDMSRYDFSFPIKDETLAGTLRPTTMLTSRGCPYGCIFCSVADQWGRKTTARSVDRVMAELEMLKNDYGYNAVYFFDDTFTLNSSRVEELCRSMIRRKLNLIWFCEVRANTVDEDLLLLMYEAGLRSVAMGVESASPRILKEVIHKGINLEQAESAIRIFKKLGIYCKVFFSYSYPEETLEDVEMTIDFIRRTKPDQPAVGRLKLYPGTPLTRLAEERGLLPEGFNWFNRYPFYNTYLNPNNVPLFVDRLTPEDMVQVEYRLNSLLLEQSGLRRGVGGLLRGFANNLHRVRSLRELRLVAQKVALHIKSRQS